MVNEVFFIIETDAGIANKLTQQLVGIGVNSNAIHLLPSVNHAAQLGATIQPTIVFCNLTQPGLAPTEAYTQIVGLFPLTAIVIVCTTGGVTNALEAIEMGACDYIVNDDINAKALEKIIAIAKSKNRAHKKLAESNVYFNAIKNNPVHAVFFTQPDGVILEANAGAAKMFGYTIDEIKKLTRQDLFDHTDPLLIKKLQVRNLAGKVTGELNGIRKNGERFPCQFSSVLFKTPAGDDRANTIVLDISDQKKIDNEREILISNTEEGFVLVNTNFEITSFNHRFNERYKMFFKKDVVLGDNILDYALPGRREIVKAIYNDVFNGQVIEDDIFIPLPDGGNVVYAMRYKPVYNDNGELYGAFVLSADVTEKRKAEQLLQTSEKRFRTLIENSEDIIMLMGPDRLVSYISPSFTKILGYTEEEILGQRPMQFAHPDNAADALKISTDALNNPGVKMKYLTRIAKKSGEYIYVEGTIINLLHVDGVNAIVNNFIDVTAQKEAREQLLASERRFRALVENSGDAIVVLSAEGESKYVSQSIKNLLGYTDNEAMALDLFGLVHPGDLPGVQKIVEDAISKPGISLPINATRAKHKSGVYRWYEATITNMLHDDSIGGIIYNVRDVTEKVEAEQKVADSNNLLVKLTNTIPAAVYQFEMDAQGNMRFPFMSKGIEDIAVGASMQTIFENPANLFSRLHPDDARRFRQSIELSRESLTDWEIEFRILNKEKEIKWIKGSSRPERKADGGTIWYGYLEDITQKKMVEEETVLSELRYRTLFDLSPTPMFTYDDTTFKFAQINKAALTFYGYTLDEMMQLDVIKIRPDYNMPDTINNIQERRNSQSYKVQTVHQKKDGTVVNVQVYNNKINVDGKDLRLAQVTDLTAVLQIKKERDFAERAFKYLSEAPNLKEGLSDVLQDITVAVGWDLAEIWIPEFNNEYIKLVAAGAHPLHPNLNGFIENSGNFRAKFGQNVPSSAMQAGKAIWVHDLQAEEKFARKELALKYGLQSGLLIPIKQADETVAELFLFSTKAEKEDKSTVELLLGIGSHIGAEIVLRKSKEELNLLFDFSPDILCIIGNDGYFKKVNPAFTQIIGYSADELLSKPYTSFIHPEDLEIPAREIENKYTGHSVFYVENRYIAKDGSIVWLSWTSSPLEDDALIYAVAKDVTNKKKDEQLLQLYNTRLENAQQIAQLGYWEYDYVTDMVYWTNEVYKIYGVEKDTYINTYSDYYSFIHPDDRKQFDIAYETLLAEKKSGEIEHRIVRPDGAVRFVYQQIGVVLGNDNTIERLEGTVQDITERKQQEEALKQLNEQINRRAEELATSNAELRKIAWMQSHLVRAPLARILGLVELLDDDGAEVDKTEIITIVKQSTVELDNVIRDIVNRTDVVKRDK